MTSSALCYSSTRCAVYTQQVILRRPRCVPILNLNEGVPKTLYSAHNLNALVRRTCFENIFPGTCTENIYERAQYVALLFSAQFISCPCCLSSLVWQSNQITAMKDDLFSFGQFVWFIDTFIMICLCLQTLHSAKTVTLHGIATFVNYELWHLAICSTEWIVCFVTVKHQLIALVYTALQIFEMHSCNVVIK